MKYFVLDIETNVLVDPTIIHCICVEDIDSNDVWSFRSADEFYDWLNEFKDYPAVWIGQNIIEFDAPQLKRIWGIDLGETSLIDTLILSRLYSPKIEGGHSLEAWGERLGYPKIHFDKFEEYSEDMLTYCRQDVSLTKKLYKHLMSKLSTWSSPYSIQIEHGIAIALRDARDRGFCFDINKAIDIKLDLEKKRAEIDELMVFPEVEKHEWFTPKKDNIKKGYIKGVPYQKTKLVPFNLNSSQQMITHVFELAGWSPTVKTEGHKEFLLLSKSDPDYNKKKIKFEKFGWKIDEHNLSTIPDNTKDLLNNCQLKILKNKESILEIITEIRKTELSNTDENVFCLMKSEKKDTNKLKKNGIQRILTTTENTTKRIKTTNHLKIELDPEYYSSVMELILQNLIDYQMNKETLALFVATLENSAWITITPQELYVHFCAKDVIPNLLGSKTIDQILKIISAREASRNYLRRLIYETRIRKIGEWISLVSDDGCVHGTILGIGTWTHRMAHHKPNMANIAAKKSIKYHTEDLKVLALELGGKLRELWIARPGYVLVGTDAEGIQLRILAHYMDDKDFTIAVTEGKKEDGTDPHSLNQKRIGRGSRENAKTFIYAFLLGAGDAKVGEIYNISRREGAALKSLYVNSTPGLKRLKQQRIPIEAKNGWTLGFDGRRILCDSEHLMMAAYLQGGEAIVMKMAVLIALRELKAAKIEAYLINVVHDEMIFECLKEDSEKVKEITEAAVAEAGICLQLKCPHKGEGKIGKTWLEVH